MKNTDDKVSLRTNIFLNLLYEVLAVICPLITAPYVSRVLQADGVGINSYTTSLLSIFTLFAALGTASYGKREISNLRENKLEYSKAFWEIELITVFSTGICLIVWIIFSLIYTMYKPYMLVLSFMLIATLFDISWFYGGLEKFKYTVSINSIFKIISVVCIFLFVKQKDDVLKYTAIMSISTLLGTVSMWFFLPKQIIRCKVQLNAIKKHLLGTLAYFGPAIATSIYTILDKTLIGIITINNAENGYYEQATKIINIIKSICFNSVNGVMIARASYLFLKENKVKLNELLNTTYHLTSFLSVGASFGIVLISSNFVPVFFGNGYLPVVSILCVLSPVVIVICISSVANSIYYIAGGYMKKSIKYILIGAVINLILNILFIFKFGAIGASVATLIAEIVIAILFINGTNGFIKWKEIFYIFYKKIIAGILMVCVVYLLSMIYPNINNNILLMIKFVLGVVIYVISLIILKDSSVKLVIKFINSKIHKNKGEIIYE